MMLQSGVRRSQSLEWTLGYRFTVHGLADPSGGYLENSSVELFSPLLAVRQEKGAYKFRLLDLVLGQMENFQPYRLFFSAGLLAPFARRARRRRPHKNPAEVF